jgi:hypothetical protein
MVTLIATKKKTNSIPENKTSTHSTEAEPLSGRNKFTESNIRSFDPRTGTKGRDYKAHQPSL